MTTRKQPYKILTLPSNHLPKTGAHYGPLGTQNPTLRAERQARPSGTLIVENQYRGIFVAHKVLQHHHELQAPEVATDLLALASINTAWYMFAQNPTSARQLQRSAVMNKRLQLPVLARETDGDTVFSSHDKTYRDALVRILKVRELARDNFAEYRERKTTQKPKNDVMGRILGSAGLALNALSLYGTNGTLAPNDAFAVQDDVRDASLTLLERARTADETIGSYPSLLQLADTDSDLMVHWRRSVPEADIDILQSAHAAAHAD